MRINRDAAAVVADGDPITGSKLNLDARCMTRDSLVHSVVENFGDEVMQSALIGSADIHAGAAANRLQALVNQYPLYSKAGEALYEAGDSYTKMGPRFRKDAGEMFARVALVSRRRSSFGPGWVRSWGRTRPGP